MPLLQPRRNSELGRGHLTTLVVSLLVLHVAAPLLQGFESFPFVALLFAFVVILALRALRMPGQVLLVLRAAAILALVGEVGVRQRLFPAYDMTSVSVAIPLTWAAFLAVSVVGLFRSIVRSDAVSEDTIQGGVAIYLIMASLFALVFEALSRANPAAFSFEPSHLRGGSEFIYFSLTTISTLGYGDLVPVAPLARHLATLEAVLGQLFLAIFMARLVAMQIASRSRRP